MNVSKYWPIVDVVLHARFQPWVSNSLSAYTGATDTYADLITLVFPFTICRKYDMFSQRFHLLQPQKL